METMDVKVREKGREGGEQAAKTQVTGEESGQAPESALYRIRTSPK